MASRIRNDFHDQIADLWESHVVFRGLARTARVLAKPSQEYGLVGFRTVDLPAYNEPVPPVEPGYVDLCASIPVPNVGNFIPLVRNSLNLACSVDILFLRHEEPMSLMKNGGDLDGRIATLFDALRMPEPKHKYVGDVPTADPLYVVLEDDVLISDLSIKTGRLLGDRTKKPHTVRLTVDVTIKVLRVTNENQCLIGG
ncbi:MAG: hypothetical protein HYR63_18985 [Proteobacteria bacterium]|nr:hypothetical protein [Pseudomonadota bacterium]MBI3498714.1 hypothetical protein [Pseudomonadota bacterium]